MKKQLSMIISTLLLGSLLLTGCAKSLEKQLASSWYFEGDDSPAWTLYSDGTCKIEGEYGAGTWALLDGDQLKLTNYYGETQTAKVISLEDGCLTIGDGGENTAKLWNSPQLAQED